MFLLKKLNQNSPFLLGGVRAGGVRAEDEDIKEAWFDERVGSWCGPFGMATINARIVRRSSALLDYGEHFNYREVAVATSEKQARKMAKQAVQPAPPAVLMKLIEAGRLPKPGEGKEQRTTNTPSLPFCFFCFFFFFFFLINTHAHARRHARTHSDAHLY